MRTGLQVLVEMAKDRYDAVHRSREPFTPASARTPRENALLYLTESRTWWCGGTAFGVHKFVSGKCVVCGKSPEPITEREIQAHMGASK